MLFSDNDHLEINGYHVRRHPTEFSYSLNFCWPYFELYLIFLSCFACMDWCFVHYCRQTNQVRDQYPLHPSINLSLKKMLFSILTPFTYYYYFHRQAGSILTPSLKLDSFLSLFHCHVSLGCLWQGLTFGFWNCRIT